MTQKELKVIHDLITAIHENRHDDLRNILNENSSLLTLSWRQGHPDGRAKETYTPLSYATSRFNLEACRIMVEEFGADPNYPADDGATPLHLAVFHDKDALNYSSDAYATVRYLVSKGANPDIKTQSRLEPNKNITTPRNLAAKKSAFNCHAVFQSVHQPQRGLFAPAFLTPENAAVAVGAVGAAAAAVGFVVRAMMRP